MISNSSLGKQISSNLLLTFSDHQVIIYISSVEFGHIFLKVKGINIKLMNLGVRILKWI